jgi:hypothetical protein
MFATTTKIRTGGRFASGRPDGFFATSAFRLLRAASSGTPGGPAPRGRGLRGELQRHQFSGPIHSAGKLLHTSWLISTSMTTVLLSRWIDAFRGVRFAYVGHSCSVSGSSRIASSAYQKWPTESSAFVCSERVRLGKPVRFRPFKV